jgi:hypothetical protein
MWRGKKVMVIALAAILLVGSSVGVVLAADNGDEAGSPPEAQHWALLDRVCEIYEENTGTTVDQQALQDAFAQARSEIQAEAMQNRLANLVNEGQITQDEADQYLEWWQSRPDVAVGFGFRGHGGFCGMGGPLGWGGPGAPTE